MAVSVSTPMEVSGSTIAVSGSIPMEVFLRAHYTGAPILQVLVALPVIEDTTETISLRFSQLKVTGTSSKKLLCGLF